MDKKTYNTLGIIIWWIFGISMVLTFYVNYFMPHGPMINTGEQCIVDGRGNERCGDRYVEDTRRLDIPEWAKFLRDNFDALFLGLPILAIILQTKGKKNLD